MHTVYASFLYRYWYCMIFVDVDYSKATLQSTVSSKTDEGSRMQTLRRNVHMDHQNLQESEEQGKLN